MAETGITELELVIKDARIKVVRGSGSVASVAVASAAAAPVAAPVAGHGHGSEGR